MSSPNCECGNTEAKLAASFYGGSGSAFEEASRMVLEMAKTSFSYSRDEEARMLREVSEKLADRAKEERKLLNEHREKELQ